SNRTESCKILLEYQLNSELVRLECLAELRLMILGWRNCLYILLSQTQEYQGKPDSFQFSDAQRGDSTDVFSYNLRPTIHFTRYQSQERPLTLGRRVSSLKPWLIALIVIA
ncbi:hypothetical protein H8959_019884, partial [Pygathrix nigripes]